MTELGSGGMGLGGEFGDALMPKPTAERPLQGVTALVVEDSRFASEAIRLLCLRSGARIRRADTLASAHRHLGVYRPTVVIIDMGLPDGSGAELIAELAGANPRVPVILGLSGDPETEAAALAAGADGFLAKPVESLASFQSTVMGLLPAEMLPKAPRVVPSGVVHPEASALAEDLTQVAMMMREAPKENALEYLIHFLEGIAKTAHDGALEEATARLARAHAEGRATEAAATDLAGLVDERLSSAAAS